MDFKSQKDVAVLIAFIIYSGKLLIFGISFAEVGFIGLLLSYLGFAAFLEHQRTLKEQKSVASIQKQLDSLNNVIANSNISKIVRRDEQKVRKF